MNRPSREENLYSGHPKPAVSGQFPIAGTLHIGISAGKMWNKNKVIHSRTEDCQKQTTFMRCRLLPLFQADCLVRSHSCKSNFSQLGARGGNFGWHCTIAHTGRVGVAPKTTQGGSQSPKCLSDNDKRPRHPPSGRRWQSVSPGPCQWRGSKRKGDRDRNFCRFFS